MASSSKTSEYIIEHLNNLRVPVSQADIDEGIRVNQFNCAITRAIQRQVPSAVRVKVNSKAIAFSLEDSDVRVTFPTPQEAIDEVIKPFDRNENPKPTVIRLKGGKVRDRDHDSDSRKARKKREWMRKESRQRDWPSNTQNTPEARKERALKNPHVGHEYLRFCPDK